MDATLHCWTRLNTIYRKIYNFDQSKLELHGWLGLDFAQNFHPNII